MERGEDLLDLLAGLVVGRGGEAVEVIDDGVVRDVDEHLRAPMGRSELRLLQAHDRGGEAVYFGMAVRKDAFPVGQDWFRIAVLEAVHEIEGGQVADRIGGDYSTSTKVAWLLGRYSDLAV